MSLTDFRDLTFVQLLWVLISLAGMIFWAALVSDQARNLSEGGNRLDPTGQAIGAWLRKRTPLQLQWIIIAVQVLIPLLSYIILAVWFDASLRNVDRGYTFIRDLVLAILVGKVYYQLTKGKGAQIISQYVTQNAAPASASNPAPDEDISELVLPNAPAPALVQELVRRGFAVFPAGSPQASAPVLKLIEGAEQSRDKAPSDPPVENQANAA